MWFSSKEILAILQMNTNPPPSSFLPRHAKFVTLQAKFVTLKADFPAPTSSQNGQLTYAQPPIKLLLPSCLYEIGRTRR